MKNSAYEDFAEAPPYGASSFARIRGTASTIIGAVAAVAILTALGTWVYRLGVRDTGEVPIIRAAKGPAKTLPDNPGGLVTPHQDVSSYQAAGGATELTVAHIAPAAPEPKPEDLAMSVMQPRSKPAPPPPVEVGEGGGPAPADEAAIPDEAIAEAPATGNAETLAEPDESDTAAAPEPGPGTGPAPATSPLAPRRPPDLAARMAAAAREAEDDATTLARRAATSPFQIQLAADPSEAVIMGTWRRVLRSNKDILRDRALAVQSTVSGGKTFYRLRVGPFPNRAEAVSVCQALKARGQDCIVARNG